MSVYFEAIPQHSFVLMVMAFTQMAQESHKTLGRCGLCSFSIRSVSLMSNFLWRVTVVESL